jgi:hypothetical protein
VQRGCELANACEPLPRLQALVADGLLDRVGDLARAGAPAYDLN